MQGGFIIRIICGCIRFIRFVGNQYIFFASLQQLDIYSRSALSQSAIIFTVPQTRPQFQLQAWIILRPCGQPYFWPFACPDHCQGRNTFYINIGYQTQTYLTDRCSAEGLYFFYFMFSYSILIFSLQRVKLLLKHLAKAQWQAGEVSLPQC